MPAEAVCSCNRERQVYARPALVTVITNNGLKRGTSYHKRCCDCGISYYTGYRVINGIKHFKHDQTSSILFISAQTAFRLDYLVMISDMIEVSGTTFTALSESYSVTHDCDLEPTRLEEAYFIHRLLSYFELHDTELCIPQRNVSCRYDIEDLCRQAIEFNLNALSMFQDHECSVPGCKEKFAMADGIEKVT